VASRVVSSWLPGLAAESLKENTPRWHPAATADGFIALRAIALGFIAPSASLHLAGVKFVPHNTPAFPCPEKCTPISPHPANLPTGGRKVKAI